MKTLLSIESQLRKVETIRYENENGGSYAYVQFMAYTRELLIALRPVKKLERHLEAIEGINWLFNECLCASFTHRHRLIFEEKMHDAKEIFAQIRALLQNLPYNTNAEQSVLHAQAA